MNKKRQQQTIVLTISTLGLMKYRRNILGRSLRSTIVEKLILMGGAKKRFGPQTDAEFAQLMAEVQAKSDVAYPNPEKWVKMPVTEVYYDGMQTFIWNDQHSANQKVILYLHGGAYINQPTSYHFKSVAAMAKQLNAKVVLPIYPKAPRYQWTDTYPKVEMIYKELIEITEQSNITVMGDSAGGGLALGMAMYIRDHQLPQPKDIVVLSPWVDVHTNHPNIYKYEPVDPMLSSGVVDKIGERWAGNEQAMDHPYVSPIFCNFEGLGKISIFVGTREILYPDNEKLHELLISKGIQHNYTVAAKMNHVYPLYPIPEAKEAQQAIVDIIRE